MESSWSSSPSFSPPLSSALSRWPRRKGRLSNGAADKLLRSLSDPARDWDLRTHDEEECHPNTLLSRTDLQRRKPEYHSIRQIKEPANRHWTSPGAFHNCPGRDGGVGRLGHRHAGFKAKRRHRPPQTNS